MLSLYAIGPCEREGSATPFTDGITGFPFVTMLARSCTRQHFFVCLFWSSVYSCMYTIGALSQNHVHQRVTVLCVDACS